jgi:glycosyltransferase involved in cell wall biosynthesis
MESFPLMSELVKDKATICIVNYKTLDFTRLCLRSIRRFTRYTYEIIVVDNDSQDASVEYLRGLRWIRLIERRADSGRAGGGYAHAAALDLGLQNCNTEFFVAMHSDTIVHKDNWLTDLISCFGGDENIVCVGSDKIELTPKWQILLKKVTDWRTFKRKLLREPDPFGKYRYYNRTICCLYRADVLCRERLSFLIDKDKGLAVGQKLYFELVDRGYRTVELSPSVMGRYVIHLAHATQAINPREFSLRKSTIRKYSRRVNKIMSWQTVQNILADDSLDK